MKQNLMRVMMVDKEKNIEGFVPIVQFSFVEHIHVVSQCDLYFSCSLEVVFFC